MLFVACEFLGVLYANELYMTQERKKCVIKREKCFSSFSNSDFFAAIFRMKRFVGAQKKKPTKRKNRSFFFSQKD